MIRRLTILAPIALALAAAPGLRPSTARSDDAPDSFAGLDAAPASPADDRSQDPPGGTMPEPAAEGEEPPTLPLDGALPASQDDFRPGRPVDEDTSASPATEADGLIPGTVDDQVYPAQDPASSATDGSDLPLSKDPPGGAAVPQDAPLGDPYIPGPERLKEGPNAVGVTAQVVAPQVANLNLESTVQILVKNTGPSEATNVRIHYCPTPEGIEIVESDPPRARTVGAIHVFQLNTLAPGAERVIKVKVRYTRSGAFDHGAVVTVQGGAKARTQARRPELKAEVRADRSSVLNGERVRFEITVTNVGDYPARDVVIQATLGPGLDHSAGRDLIYSLREAEGLEALAPGQSQTLPLLVTARSMGPQSCEVAVVSPDEPRKVAASAEVDVIAPQLQVGLAGPDTRYPDARGDYTLTVTNAGTAPAKKVRVEMQVQNNGVAESAEPRPDRYDRESRILQWNVEDLPTGESRAFTVRVRMTEVGKLLVKSRVSASGLASVYQPKSTEVVGMPNVRFTVNEPRGVLDVGEETEYKIRLVNNGSAEAREVKVSAQFSDHFQVLAVSGANGKPPTEAQPSPDGRLAVLPFIEALPPGPEGVTLSVRVRAVKEGTGSCEVSVSHKDLDVGERTTRVTRVTPASGLQR